MKINKLLPRLVFFCLLVGTTACIDKYEGYNTNKHEATDEERERDGYALASTLNGMGNFVVSTEANRAQFMDCLLGGSFGGYMADSNDGFNGRNYACYNPVEHWIQVAFNDMIPDVFSRYYDMRALTEDVVPLAVSDIQKVIAICRITDIYGPIPYSRIGLDGALTAPYDSQEEVYNKMLEELDGAIQVLTENRTNDFTPKADNVYSGIVESWIRLANSFKLRMAMRIADVSPVLARTKAEEVASHIIGPMTSNRDNASKPMSGGTNPYRVVMYDYNDGDSRISADIISYMNGYDDPRRERYFTESVFPTLTPPTVNGYFGLRSGILIPGGGRARYYSNMRVGAGDNVLWMNAAETAFLRAEGALRGWNMGGTAEEFYKQGISLSFDQWGATGASAYTENSAGKPIVYVDPLGLFSYTGTTSSITVKWNTSSSFEENLERIITQKWIANFPLGIEAWSEFRRTGYPKLMQVATNNSGGRVSTERMARRLPYPQREYNQNAENVRAAVSQYLQGPDNMGTDVWWAKKN